VLNTRTRQRSAAFGEPGRHGRRLELRFMAANADVQRGRPADHQRRRRRLPAGPAGGRGVDKVERRAESAFARIALAAGRRWPTACAMCWCWSRFDAAARAAAAAPSPAARRARRGPRGLASPGSEPGRVR
jgi:rod shape-determining protein MreC